ncbi:hypothetical protein BH11MYX2_BH11MYX2_04960 [soil metagenome]
MSEDINRASSVPADQGLSTLGLVMQLMGTVLSVCPAPDADGSGYVRQRMKIASPP